MTVLLLVFDEDLAQQLLGRGERLSGLQLMQKRQLSHRRLAPAPPAPQGWMLGACVCGTSYRVFLQRVNEQSVSEDGPAVFGHFGLLLGPGGGGGHVTGEPYKPDRAGPGHLRIHVVFKRKDDGVRRRLEGALCYGLNHFLQSRTERSKPSGLNIKAKGANKHFSRVPTDVNIYNLQKTARFRLASERFAGTE